MGTTLCDVAELLLSIRDELRGMKTELLEHEADLAVVNRLTAIIGELEELRGVKDELDEADGPRIF